MPSDDAGSIAVPVRGLLSEILSFGANPGALRMFRYVPEGLKPGAPLVVILHGCGQNAQGHAVGAGWIGLAERHGFALLAPEQRQQNSMNTCFNWFTPEDVARTGGEVEFIRAMIAAVVSEQKIDPKRIFVTGLSAGGAMTVAMLAAYPEVFAAGAVIAGLAYRSADNLQQAMGAMMQGRKRAPEEWGDKVRAASTHAGPWPPISIWHGTSDIVVNAQNAEAIAQQWINLHGLDVTPTVSETNGVHTRTIWGGAVELNLIAGMAHGVPIMLTGDDPCGAAGAYFCDAGISSSTQLARAWGLAKPAVAAPLAGVVVQEAVLQAKRAKRPPAPIKVPAPSVLPAQESKRGGIDVGEVIKKALTAAGLMRR